MKTILLCLVLSLTMPSSSKVAIEGLSFATTSDGVHYSFAVRNSATAVIENLTIAEEHGFIDWRDPKTTPIPITLSTAPAHTLANALDPGKTTQFDQAVDPYESSVSGDHEIAFWFKATLRWLDTSKAPHFTVICREYRTWKAEEEHKWIHCEDPH